VGRSDGAEGRRLQSKERFRGRRGRARPHARPAQATGSAPRRWRSRRPWWTTPRWRSRPWWTATWRSRWPRRPAARWPRSFGPRRPPGRGRGSARLGAASREGTSASASEGIPSRWAAVGAGRGWRCAARSRRSTSLGGRRLRGSEPGSEPAWGPPGRGWRTSSAASPTVTRGGSWASPLQRVLPFDSIDVCRWRSSAVERLICNQRVGGSIPSASSTRRACVERGPVGRRRRQGAGR
jgi:hypothetical protein